MELLKEVAMRRYVSEALAVSLAIAAALPGFAQSPPTQILPYTAELRITTVHTLADSTTITRQTKMVKARDAQGRILTVTSSIPEPDSQPDGFLIGIVNDSANDTFTSWESRTHQAVIRQGPPPGQMQGCWADNNGTNLMNYSGTTPPNQQNQQSVKPTEENLGTKMIDGVLAVGHRRTWVTPAGTVGNSAPLVRTEEVWSAPSLGGQTLSLVNDDPQNGKQTTELVSLTLGEPQPSLFQPPPEYEIVTVTSHQVPCP
jgi:hypothetical protein